MTFSSTGSNTLLHTNPTSDSPVLLVLDGHKTHTLNLEVINLARANHVTLLCLPPHCSHRLQPLDVGFMKPVMTYYTHEVETWLRNHPGRVVTMFQIGELFGNASMRAATVQTAVNAFRKTGISPLNRHVFSDDDFSPSMTTDRPLPSASDVANLQSTSAADMQSVSIADVAQEQTVVTHHVDIEALSSADGHTCSDCPLPLVDVVSDIEQSVPLDRHVTSTPIRPSGQSLMDDERQETDISHTEPVPTSSHLVHSKPAVPITAVSPVPSCHDIGTLSARKPARARGKTAVLTSSPYKRMLEVQKQQKPANNADTVKQSKKLAKGNKTRKEPTASHVLKKSKDVNIDTRVNAKKTSRKSSKIATSKTTTEGRKARQFKPPLPVDKRPPLPRKPIWLASHMIMGKARMFNFLTSSFILRNAFNNNGNLECHIYM